MHSHRKALIKDSPLEAAYSVTAKSRAANNDRQHHVHLLIKVFLKSRVHL